MPNFDGISWYGDWTIEDQIIYNVINFMKWGFLEIGAYYNISKDQVNYNGVNESILNPVMYYGSGGVPNFTVYKGLKHDWVWESGIALQYGGGTPPITISGIFANDVFCPLNSGVNGTGYTVDYSRGQVIFHNPLNSGYTIKCPNTIRMVNVYSDEGNEYKQLTQDWMAQTHGSGVYSSRELAYLPGVFVGVESRRSTAKEIGSRAKYPAFRLRFDILAANAYESKKLADIIDALEEKTIPLYNLNSAPFPLNVSGAITSGTLTWPQLVSGYTWQFGRFLKDCQVTRINSTLPIHHRRAFISFERQ